MSNDSVEMRMFASAGASLTSCSSKEKKPSRHDISSNTTSSTWKRTCRSSSLCVSAPLSTSSSPSLRRACGGALRVARAREVGLGDLAAAQQQLAQRMRIAADRGEHHCAPIEVHRALIVAQHGGDRERPGLPAEIEQLEDIVDAELAERSLDRH